MIPRRGSTAFIALALTALSAVAARATDATDLQLAGSNRLEYGTARQDGAESLDDLFRLEARWRGFTVGARLHVSQPSGGAAAESLDQRWFAYAGQSYEILAGTFYETWGAGLLLRAYEARSATVGRVERSLAFDRDIDGVRLRGARGPLRGTLLSGRPRRTALSGEIDSESGPRIDRLRGARLEARPADPFTLAGSWLRVNVPEGDTGRFRTDEFHSLETTARFDFGEVRAAWAARRLEAPVGPARTGDATSVSASGYQGPFTLTYEFKDNESFQAAYNEPPTLVKTQSWTLLNRQTHVTNPNDEVGHQVEAGWSPGPESGLTLNYSRSDHHDFDALYRYRQWTLEGRHRLGESGPRLKLVVDRAEDALKGDDERWTVGGEFEAPLSPDWSLTTIAEWQQTDLLFLGRGTRRLAQLELQRASLLTLTALVEKSSESEEGHDTFPSLTVNLNRGNHNLNLFYGRRPTGFLCTGGYCFLARAFDGFEARLVSRF